MKFAFDNIVVNNIVLLIIAAISLVNALINRKAKSTVAETKVTVCEVKELATKTHTIVNSQKTAMMEELKTSRSLTLGMANALLRLDPGNSDLKTAVITAQALYDKSVTDAKIKEEEPRK